MQIRYRTELPDLMRRLGLPMVAAEIGVAQGLFSAELLQLGIRQLYSVDNWATIKGQKGDGGSPREWHDKNYSLALLRLMEFTDRSIILKGLSTEMALQIPDDSLGLVYLDGDHSFEGVMADLNAWFPKLVKGGIMTTHDYLAPEYGCKKAFEDFFNTHESEVSKIYLLLENKKEDAGAYFFKQ